MNQYKYKINGNTYNVVVNKKNDTLAEVEVNGRSYTVEMEKDNQPKVAETVQRPAQPAPAPKPAAPSTPAAKPQSATASAGSLKSPLPGIILSIACKVGDTVKKGQIVLVLEAMKMENNVIADKDGKVTAVKVNVGDSVLEGSELVTIE
ncbi:biotin/lipoyl-containing protein [Bacteroides heparinolyticus]|uniref:biotin/lipoyl-containing protein n=1 Tax=Prevotella heparinolytica TaxID=28113 RepID=UPI0035A16774